LVVNDNLVISRVACLDIRQGVAGIGAARQRVPVEPPLVGKVVAGNGHRKSDVAAAGNSLAFWLGKDLRLTDRRLGSQGHAQEREKRGEQKRVKALRATKSDPRQKGTGWRDG